MANITAWQNISLMMKRLPQTRNELFSGKCYTVKYYDTVQIGLALKNKMNRKSKVLFFSMDCAFIHL